MVKSETKWKVLFYVLLAIAAMTVISSFPISQGLDVSESRIITIATGRSFLVTLPEAPKLACERLARVRIDRDKKKIFIGVRTSYFLPRYLFQSGHQSSVVLQALFPGTYEVFVTNGIDTVSAGSIEVTL